MTKSAAAFNIWEATLFMIQNLLDNATFMTRHVRTGLMEGNDFLAIRKYYDIMAALDEMGGRDLN